MVCKNTHDKSTAMVDNGSRSVVIGVTSLVKTARKRKSEPQDAMERAFVNNNKIDVTPDYPGSTPIFT
jgi:hypothetical protein